ncbi:glutamine-hydrolyzing carbamoyl-phosphate synthase small subunit [Nitriliruptor alkaliphilus]|uniref:glutamine-hydrolyzing carbamoyl-phosphate synthase small subunit n=1 Tax=Nitriliruptor alkaliphilus TaxID=427918 RepID=UPI0006985258|nr:glutamine-hydrolyzing carbamoyl-phosphate synthase small subunit [Nitriliruptor alkaliphilus]
MSKDALLVLEDGTHLRGRGFGATGTVTGEAVFNTGMAGYQEVLSDPSYRRQIVAMTAPHVGNYGMNPDDMESDAIQVAGFVVREAARRPSSWRSQGSLTDALRDADVVGIEGVDTRRLTRHLRDRGAMRAALSTEILDVDALVERALASPSMVGADLASEATTSESYVVPAAGETVHRVVALDFGMKRSIVRGLAEHGAEVHVLPASATPDDVLALEPDGVFLSNGPGDPSAVTQGIATTAGLLGQVPVFGICLGSQLLGHAFGADTYKLTFGHRGVNQPVLRRSDGLVEITSHNHGFAVQASSLGEQTDEYTFETAGLGTVEVSHVNLNDDVVEGLTAHDVRAFSVQYHPEAAPGPSDARYLFERFAQLIRGAN